MLTPREDYDRQWAAHTTRGPKADPRGPQHRPYEPPPDFVALCDLAKSRGLTIGLAVSAGFTRVGEDSQVRKLERIKVVFDKTTVHSAQVHGDLDGSARSLLEQIG